MLICNLIKPILNITATILNSVLNCISVLHICNHVLLCGISGFIAITNNRQINCIKSSSNLICNNIKSISKILILICKAIRNTLLKNTNTILNIIEVHILTQFTPSQSRTTVTAPTKATETTTKNSGNNDKPDDSTKAITPSVTPRVSTEAHRRNRHYDIAVTFKHIVFLLIVCYIKCAHTLLLCHAKHL